MTVVKDLTVWLFDKNVVELLIEIILKSPGRSISQEEGFLPVTSPNYSPHSHHSLSHSS